MNKKNVLRGLAAIVIISSISVVTACANSGRSGGPNGGPPPEAITACEGKKEGDSVSFAGRRGESLSATCQLIDDQLVAVPEGHK